MALDVRWMIYNKKLVMTDKQLEKIGLIKDGHNPRQYWCYVTQSHITILRRYTHENILQLIFNEGMSQGIVEGKTQRSNQLLRILHNED